jgi:hypothetical protein
MVDKSTRFFVMRNDLRTDYALIAAGVGAALIAIAYLLLS